MNSDARHESVQKWVLEPAARGRLGLVEVLTPLDQEGQHFVIREHLERVFAKDRVSADLARS